MDLELGRGIVGIDSADMKNVIDGSRRLLFSIENGHNTEEIARKIGGARGLLIGINGKSNTKTEECQKIVESLCKSAKSNSRVFWSFNIRGRKKILVIAAW